MIQRARGGVARPLGGDRDRLDVGAAGRIEHGDVVVGERQLAAARARAARWITS